MGGRDTLSTGVWGQPGNGRVLGAQEHTSWVLGGQARLAPPACLHDWWQTHPGHPRLIYQMASTQCLHFLGFLRPECRQRSKAEHWPGAGA